MVFHLLIIYSDYPLRFGISARFDVTLKTTQELSYRKQIARQLRSVHTIRRGHLYPRDFEI